MGLLVTLQGGFAACSVYNTLFFPDPPFLTTGSFYICPNMMHMMQQYAR